MSESTVPNGGRVKVQAVMDDQAFGWMFHTFREWASQMDGTPIAPDSGWRNQISDGRFAVCGGQAGPVSVKWKWSCWTDGYTDILLASAYLDAWGIDYQAVTDEAGGWGILTDYETEGLKR